MGWEHRTPKENGGSCLFVQLEEKKSAGAGHGVLQLPAGRVKDSSAMLLSKVNSERMRGNSHRLQKGNLLLGTRKKFCCEGCWTLHQAPRQAVGSPPLEMSTQNETGQGLSNLPKP